jgi:spore coat protein U-like protein
MGFLGNTLNYNLFTTSSHATIWGDGTTPTQTQSYSAGAGSTAFTMYGLIPTHQFVPLGLYADTIQVVVSF